MNSDLRLGQLVQAKRATGVCDAGEVGVVYEIYQLLGRPGYSVIFESGRYDGFSPDDVAAMLHVLDAINPEIACYQFKNVGRVYADYRAGVFSRAFITARDVVMVARAGDVEVSDVRR